MMAAAALGWRRRIAGNRVRGRAGQRLWCVAAALAGVLVMLAGRADAQPYMKRLPRARFDVIAPDMRVTGNRGAMRIVQPGCRVGPTHWARRRIVDIAVQEWSVFGFQIIDATHVSTHLLPAGIVPDALNPETGAHIARAYPHLGTMEDSERVAATIAGYWSATPDGARILAQQNRAWNGPGGEAVNWVQPWSAAFVSWVMCEAGLGEMKQFARSIAHRVYIDQAIRARDGKAPDAAYTAYNAGEQPVAPGDLLCNSRAGTDYRSLADRREDTGRYAPTHCDIVVKVDEPGRRILVIGGNVEQSVSLTILPAVLSAHGFLRPVDKDAIAGARTVFAHLKLNADPVERDALDHSPTIDALNDPALRAALAGD